MRLDRLPVDAAVVGFLITAMIFAFGLAFVVVERDDGEAGEPTEPAETTPADGNGDGELVIVMTDNAFDPDAFTVTAGETITIPVENHGGSLHNVHIADENGDYADDFCDESSPGACSDPDRIAGGGDGTITWDVPGSPGAEIPFRCDYHPVEMTGTITIE
jgi:plastocyanin